MMELDKIRREYNYAEIGLNTESDPLNLFRKWIEEALNSASTEPTAMSLITNGLDGYPQSRVVLLKQFDENGFVFFTNYNSEKGKSISENPKVGLHFFWPELERQIRISGIASKTSTEVSDNYFDSRPLSSRIGVLVSDQSSIIPSREHLDEKFAEISKKYVDKKPERPEFWGGFIVKPVKYEFWQGRPNRLHDRLIYCKTSDCWNITRIAP